MRQALEEDLGRAGDVTTQCVVSQEIDLEARIVTRAEGCLAGLGVARLAFHLLGQDLTFTPKVCDGTRVKAGETVALVQGNARSILTAERVALNFLGHLSGIATATLALVESIVGTQARICCTRKTTPNLRLLEKYAVVCGGGVNHRFGLDDGLLVKDNHIAAAGGITQSLSRIRQHAGHMLKLEVEVDTLNQLSKVLDLGVDAVLLDNMTPATLVKAVRLVDGRAITEASGGITLNSARIVAETGVNYISTGWITHSAPSLNVALDVYT